MSDLQQFTHAYLPYLPIVAGITLTAWCILKTSLKEKLKGKGIYTDAIIFRQGYKKSSVNDGFSDAPDKLTVRLTTRSNEWITTVAKNEFGIYYTNRYEDGESVKILYNPDDPGECVLVSKQSEDVAPIILAIIGVAIVVTGVYLLLSQ